MYKGIIIIQFIFILSAQSPWEDLVNPTNMSGVFQGITTLAGENSIEIGDWVAAIDEDGNIAGAGPFLVSAYGAGGIIFNDTTLINLTIYGDDPTSSDVDEGINSGESFILKLWDSSDSVIYEYPESFDCWFNNQGAPMDGCGDVNTVYNFVYEELSLNDQWIPDKVLLNQNYPNPFNIETTILFNLNNSENISLDIININGIHVKRIFRGNLNSGEYSIKWNGESDLGEILPSGIYFYTLSYSQNDIVRSFTRKMELIK